MRVLGVFRAVVGYSEYSQYMVRQVTCTAAKKVPKSLLSTSRVGLSVRTMRNWFGLLSRSRVLVCHVPNIESKKVSRHIFNFFDKFLVFPNGRCTCNPFCRGIFQCFRDKP